MRVGTAAPRCDAAACSGIASEERIDERRDRARLREDDEQPEQYEYDDDWNEPVLLLLAKELEKFGQDASFTHNPSKHAFEMPWIPVSVRIRQPSAPRSAPPSERILADQTPHDAHRRQDQKKRQRQQHTRVHPAEHRCQLPPRVAWVFEQQGLDRPEQ